MVPRDNRSVCLENFKSLINNYPLATRSVLLWSLDLLSSLFKCTFHAGTASCSTYNTLQASYVFSFDNLLKGGLHRLRLSETINQRSIVNLYCRSPRSLSKNYKRQIFQTLWARERAAQVWWGTVRTDFFLSKFSRQGAPILQTGSHARESVIN
jgi:hypothetical protein